MLEPALKATHKFKECHKEEKFENSTKPKLQKFLWIAEFASEKGKR